MRTEEIAITISPDGVVSMRVSGVPGTACLEATAALEKALGGQVLDRTMTGGDQPGVSGEEHQQQSGGGE